MRSKDAERDERIENEIIVDCYGELEQMIGWHCYLDDILQFPFKATCISQRTISPLQVGEAVKVVGMADQNDCFHEMFVQVEWKKRKLSVPLAQLQPSDKSNEERNEAIADWKYWSKQA